MIEKQEQITTIITEALMHKHLLFSAIIDSLLSEFTYRDILLSWGELREEGLLKMDQEGLYYLEQ